MTEAPVRIGLDEARVTPPRAGRASALLLAHGSLELRYYAPRGRDPQTPHSRDELYVVASGVGWFVRGGARTLRTRGRAVRAGGRRAPLRGVQ